MPHAGRPVSDTKFPMYSSANTVTKAVSNVLSLNPHNVFVNQALSPILQMRKPRLIDAKESAQGHNTVWTENQA